MNNIIDKEIERLKNSQTISCTKPWTTLDERSILGDFKVCCWLKNFIGQIPKTSEQDIMELWNCPEIQKLRRLMINGTINEVCSSWCNVLKQRSDYFNILEFWSYDPLEYDSYPQAFKDNRERTVRAIIDGKTEIDTFPTRLHLYPSQLCNLDCRMCDFDKSRSVKVSNNYFQNVYKLMPYLEDIGIWGGEPFACKTTRKIIFGEEIRKHPQLRLTTITNGTLLDDQTQEKLKDLRMGLIQFSLDSCKEDTYKHIRRGADFSQTISNLKGFIKRSQTGEFSVKSISAAFVIQDINYNEIPDFVEFTHALNIEPAFILVEKSKELLGNIKDLKRSIEKGRNIAERQGRNQAVNELTRIWNDLSQYKRRERKELILAPLRKKIGSRQVTEYFNRHPILKQQIKKLLGI